MSEHHTQPDGTWHIRLLGKLQITDPEGRSTPVAGRKTGELLAYLALNSNRSHTRERLIELIWGDSDISDVRTRLRQEIAKLRAIFEACPEFGSPLILNKDMCQLSGAIAVDAITFRERLSQAESESQLEARSQLLSSAAEMYSDGLLPNYDASWILAERASISQAYADSLLRLAETLQGLARFAEAEEALLKLVSFDKSSERAHIALMRLYAELGQPKRLQDQHRTLNAVLDKMGGLKPTEATAALSDTLYALARQRAAELEGGVVVSPAQPGNPIEPPGIAHASESEDVVVAPTVKRSARSLAFLHTTAIPAAVIFAALLTFAFARAQRSHLPSTVRAAAADPMRLNFAYTYASRSGEKPNSEAKAVVSDWSGIYVTGLVQTVHEDTDILTVKLSAQGKPIWVDRYSGPEHDCDRAFSMCVDGNGGIYVAGESYIPAGSKSKLLEGWHLVLIHYNGEGSRLWVRRSNATVKNETGGLQMCAGPDKSCYIGATQVAGKKRSALVMRYRFDGSLAWRQSIQSKEESVFSSLVAGSDGSLYLCGSTYEACHRSGTDIDTDWIVARVDANGKIDWTDRLDGGSHGADAANTIAVDQGGNVIVGGVLQIAEGASRSTSRLTVALKKYSPDGKPIWQRTVNTTGPAVSVCGLSINGNSDIAFGGTEQLANGECRIVLSRFDRYGNQTLYKICPVPAPMRSAYLSSLCLGRDDQMMLTGVLGPVGMASIADENQAFISKYSAEGQLHKESIYSPSPQTTNYIRGVESVTNPVLVGQTGSVNGPHALMVLSYQQ